MQIHLTAELGVHKDNVANCQRHSEAPPSQTHSERVRVGDGTAEGDIVCSAGRSGKQSRIKPPARSGKHEEQIEAGREKCFNRLGLAIQEPDTCQ